LRHREFLAPGAADPRREFAETLVAALSDPTAPVLVYSPFESTQLGALAGHFPDLAPGLRRIRERLVDLLPIVRSHLYHPDFDFSFSIKNVAPALAPGLDWGDLGPIADGTAASNALAALASGRTAPEEQAPLRAALLAYCARDTLALAKLHAALRGMVR
jgi:predicted RecB family nuclease